MSDNTPMPDLLHLFAYAAIFITPIVIVVDLIFLIPTIHGAIYYPSSDPQIATMLDLAQIKKGERAVDIGSGDGRIVRALARAGAHAHGYELNPFLVFWSWWQERALPKSQRGHHHLANLWFTSFASFDVVILFGMTYIMKDLEKKLLRELKPGTRVVSNSFPFPNWKPVRRVGNIYLYIR